jgi:hypothetical protein
MKLANQLTAHGGALARALLITLLFIVVPSARARDDLDTRMPVRGFCVSAPGPKSLDAFVTFVEKELAPRHVNTLIMRVDYRYQFKSHPEMADNGSLSGEEAKKLVAVCRTHRIRLIPHINLLGHQSWATTTGKLLKQHPEFDETPEVKMPEQYKWPNPDGLYCKSYCPLHPEVHKVVFPLIDELCDAFESDAFHAGMDEVFYIGNETCPRCRGRDKGALFAGEVSAIHDHLAKNGRQLWIWGDRLLDGKRTGLGEWEASYSDTWRAINLIPKDVTICDWHYERPTQTAVYFATNGFKVVTCGYRSPKTSAAQARDMVRWRRTATNETKERYLGVMQTVWSDAGRFLSTDYAGKGTGKNAANNAWTSFQAMFDEVLAQHEKR